MNVVNRPEREFTVNWKKIAKEIYKLPNRKRKIAIAALPSEYQWIVREYVAIEGRRRIAEGQRKGLESFMRNQKRGANYEEDL